MNAVMTLGALVGGHGTPAGRLISASLATRDEPHAELLALLWGSRFDREHAQELLSHAPARDARALVVADAWRLLARAADQYDALPRERQQRLRQRIALRHARQCQRQSAACPASC